MPILVKPNLGCNKHCAYCYEGIYRNSHGQQPYDIAKVLKAMEEQYRVYKTSFGLHGGEPLQMLKQDVEAILAKSYELGKSSSIQTNGLLIDTDHIAMFQKYHTSVGLSMDGLDELNSFRMSLQETDKLMSFIRKYHKELNLSVICVLSKANISSDARVNKLKEWLHELAGMGICGRLNPCGGVPDCEVSQDRLQAVMLDLAKFNLEHGYSWSPFVDIARKVRGESAVCTFMGCDPFYTDSAIVILGDGSVTNCMRTNQADILLRNPVKTNIRNEVLQEIPQEHGGCRGCVYWEACMGGCPSMAISNDWRNRTYLCEAYKPLFGFYTRISKALGVTKAARSNKVKSGHTDTHSNTPHTDQVRRS